MANDFEELDKLIKYIQGEYDKITDEWLSITDLDVNFKRSLICDIETDSAIYKNILDYVQLLNERSADITLRLPFVCSRQVTARVKSRNSIEYKIEKYKTSRHEYGKVPINKCINDLFGARIILLNQPSLETVYNYVHDVYESKYKHRDASNGDYRAIHLHFKRDNTTFQWELQIWNACDVETNFRSHSAYKQEYTTWESEVKKGGIFDG